MDKTHVIIEIDSREKDRGTIDNFSLILDTPIDLNRNRQYYVRVENIRVPTSFYNLNAFNNILKLTEDPAGTPDLLTITVPIGNYNESELRTILVSLLNAASIVSGNNNTFTINFDDITGKMTFTTDVTEFTVESKTSGSTINRNIGFATDVSNTSVSMSLISTDHVALNSRRYLKLDTGLGSNNHYTKTTIENVTLQIPITEGRSTIQFYSNHDGYKAKLESFHQIKQLRMRITDADKNPVDFNGVDWSCEIVIYEWRG